MELHRKDMLCVWKKWRTNMLDAIYPRRCPGCNEILSDSEKEVGFCTSCNPKVVRIRDRGCVKCGKILDSEQMELCTDCKRKHHFFVQNRSIYAYDGPMRPAMYRFKYANCRAYAEAFASDGMKLYGDWLQRMHFDAIVPVPMYCDKERKRGYNQATVFARALSEKIDVPLMDRYVVRSRNTIPQKNLNDTERKKNLENAFKIRQRGVKLKKILLIDDIYTTGSTMDEVARTLMAAGAEEIYCMSVCVGRGQ